MRRCSQQRPAKGVPPTRPPVWEPSVALSAIEQTIVTRIKRAKLSVFLRQQRHTLFDAAFQQELATIYQDAPSAPACACFGVRVGRVMRQLACSTDEKATSPRTNTT
jgi:hypothetical protein